MSSEELQRTETVLAEDRDTIVAISTAPGAAAIGMVRLSGPDAFGTADRVFAGTRSPSEMNHSTVQFGRIIQDGAVLDEVMLTVLRSPNSYTGEDMVEISCHGASLILKDVLSAVIAAGARLATGGEFTRRAFLHGKMDLCQAEAVMELLSAETEEAKRIALLQVQGRTSDTIKRLRDHVIRVKAELDASIDFPEDMTDEAQMQHEETADESLPGNPGARLRKTLRQLDAMLAAFAQSLRLWRVPMVAIIGKVNVGKSTILNSLLSEERAITSKTPGTTRDRIDSDLILPTGRNVRLSDTAGVLGRIGRLESPPYTLDELDSKARAKMEQAAEGADVRVIVFDASSALESEDKEIIERWGDRPAVIVMNKIDLGECWAPDILRIRFQGAAETPSVRICAISGLGVDALKAALDELLKTVLPDAPSDACVMGTIRDENLLRRARAAIGGAMNAMNAESWPEFASRDLDEALDAFNELLGIEVGVDILDEVFSRFCIGK